MTQSILTQSRLKELLHYCPKQGLFTWINSDRGGWNGKIAGSVNSIGYVKIYIDSRSYAAHRLAFLYMLGGMPEQVDHVDHDRINNVWHNLRAANAKVNTKNASRYKTNKSGVCGVYWRGDQSCWAASIKVNTKQIHLGSFKNKHKAVAVRKAAEVAFEFHENHGE